MSDDEKVDEVVLFLLQRAAGGRLSATKLWKLLYYVDLMHEQQFGRPVTGLAYRKDRHGPCPDGGTAVLQAMADKGAISLLRVPRFGRRCEVVCQAARQPNLRRFDFSERAILAEVALDWMGATGAQLEAAIHEGEPWKRSRRAGAIGLLGAAYAA